MGSGKSYIGKKLSEYWNCDFYDLDVLIEKNEGLTIVEIFEKYGQSYFREKETEMLKSNFLQKYCIVSTGGGTPCFNNNQEYMNQNGFTIYLETDIKLLVERLWKQKEQRPLLKNIESKIELENFTQGLLDQRKIYYLRSMLILKVTKENENNILTFLTNKIKN